jgi:DnaJ-class molecular chaperone
LPGGFEAMVRIPPGVKPGQKLRLAGLGGPGRPPGDAFVELSVHIPNGLELKGRDLVGVLTVTPMEARRGTTRRLAGLEVTVPPGARHGARLRVGGGGLAGGDLLLRIDTDVWRGLSSAVAQGAGRAVQDSWGGWRELWRRMSTAGRKP